MGGGTGEGSFADKRDGGGGGGWGGREIPLLVT